VCGYECRKKKNPSASVQKDLSETLKFEKREEQSLLVN
jgi:hypothetical protein